MTRAQTRAPGDLYFVDERIEPIYGEWRRVLITRDREAALRQYYALLAKLGGGHVRCIRLPAGRQAPVRVGRRGARTTERDEPCLLDSGEEPDK
jgi:hypothetical protein